jgi:NAD(P)-dependent dehydrogenase (short-subunit alcohol dehydrogenase family)
LSAFAPSVLAGKATLVVGGSRGLGLAIGKRFAQHGARVAVLGRDETRLSLAVEQIAAQGGEALGLIADLLAPERLVEVFAQVAERWGPIDSVVAAQSGNFYLPVVPAVPKKTRGFSAVIESDLIGTFNLFNAARDRLRRPGASLIALCAPEWVKALHPQAHVAAARAGVEVLVRALAEEWGPEGVRANAILPGGIAATSSVPIPEATAEKIAAQIPLRRLGTADEVADAALFLASDAASYVTGALLAVDGGAGPSRTARLTPGSGPSADDELRASILRAFQANRDP